MSATRYIVGVVAVCVLSSVSGCPAGQYYDDYSRVCKDCAPGRFQSSQTTGNRPTSCSGSLCAAGTFGRFGATSSSEASCTSCPSGQYQSNTGQSSCVGSSCAAGTFGRLGAASSSATHCTSCAFGQYQSNTGQSSCIQCNEILDGCQCGGKRNDWPSNGICLDGYACQKDQNCRNRATCKPSGEGNVGHTCDCHSEDLFGLSCEHSCLAQESDVTREGDGWCANLGTCIYDEADRRGYRCDCKEGYGGAHCTTMDPCIVLNPCHNGAECETGVASGEYTCNCPTGFFGKNCTALIGKWGNFGSSDALLSSDSLLLIFGILGVATYWGSYYVILEFETAANTTKIFAAFGCWLISATGITAINWRQCDSDRALICTPASIGPGGSFELYGIVMAMFIVQTIIAVGLQRLVGMCCTLNGGGRLQRGAGLPLLALLCASPCIAVGIWMNPDRLSATYVDIVADIGVIYSWEAVTFGVLVPCLPIAAVLARVYCKQEHRHRTATHKQFARVCAVPREADFRKTELAFAYFSGMLLPLFWVSYMVNEMQEFWSFAACDRNRTGSYVRGRELASLDGVRALSPVVCTLNLLALIWGMYIIVVFPAPLKWTASMYFGVVWCGMAVLVLLGLTLILIRSLSETREAAQQRTPENFWGYGEHGYKQNNCFIEVVCCIKRFVLSWTGQTCISGVNHFLAIVLFSYGLSSFGEVMTLSLKKFLYSGIGMTVFGVFTSFGSFIMRQKPAYKCLPVDDSFRLACVLKALLVMNKALIVYELSKIDMSDNQALRHWTMVVTVVCVMSIFILGLLTYAFEALKIYREPALVENVGVESGKRFVKMYTMSFVCCKLAASFFVLLGHIPDIAGCDSSPITFHGPRNHNSSVECIVCYVNNQPPGNAPPNPLCENNSPINYNRCTTTCTKLFFSGGGEIAVSLDVFVLVPLLWLPFAVYSNNEVARMLDGIWQTERARQTERAVRDRDPPKNSAIANLLHVVFKKECQDASNRIGLSSTVLGYRAIANLSHAVFLVCFAFTVYFMFATGGGYYVDVGSICGVSETGGSICGPELDAVQQPLKRAGRYVTCSIVGLNILMLLRFSYEKLPSLWCATESELVRDLSQRVQDLERQLLENQQGSE